MSGVARLRAAAPVHFEAIEQPLVGGVRCRWLVHHNNVHAFNQVLVLSERLANNALESITASGKPAVLLRDREPEPRWPGRTSPAQHREKLVVASRRIIEDAIEVSGDEEPLFFGEATWLANLNAFRVLQRLGGRLRSRYGVSLARPLARRRFSTRRPAFVAILARKP